MNYVGSMVLLMYIAACFYLVYHFLVFCIYFRFSSLTSILYCVINIISE